MKVRYKNPWYSSANRVSREYFNFEGRPSLVTPCGKGVVVHQPGPSFDYLVNGRVVTMRAGISDKEEAMSRLQHFVDIAEGKAVPRNYNAERALKAYKLGAIR